MRYRTAGHEPDFGTTPAVAPKIQLATSTIPAGRPGVVEA